MLTRERVQADLNALPAGYKTADVDRLIRRYVREKQDVSGLRGIVLEEQQFHRIYFHTSLLQLRDPDARLAWLDRNLLFSDWWHTDENIDFVRDADFGQALALSRGYVRSGDPFIGRGGYVMFISRQCRQPERLAALLSLFHDDGHYYVQMGEAWLLAELAVFFPAEVHSWLSEAELPYAIAGKAIQKICDSFRVSPEDKARFRALRSRWKTSR